MSQLELQHSVPTAGETVPCSSLQSWEIENTDSANSIFISEKGAVTVASTVGGSEVSAGSTRTFFFDPRENALIGMRAVTGAVLANIRRETFRSRLGWNIARYASIRVQQAEQFLVRVSATVVRLGKGFTEFHADTFDAKTAANGLSIGPAMPSGGVVIGGAGLTAGSVRVGADTGETTEYLTTQIIHRTGGTVHELLSTAATSFSGGRPIVFFDGALVDPRHTLNSTARVLHTPVAGGDIASALDTIERPIDNGTVIAAGDLVMISSTTGRLTPATTGNITQPVIGPAATGATGDAGGTVFARVDFGGFYYGMPADVAGVVGGQFVKPGTTTANRVESQTTPSLITFGRSLITRANGVATEIALRGMG